MLPGGVCAVLDYEVDQMTEYVAEMTQRMLMPNMPVAPPFRKFVSGLLSSTRLPSTTILLGLNLLAKRTSLSFVNTHLKPVDAGITWRLLTTGLLLGSKFLDDNTFQNRSWSEVSSIPVTELNKLEYEWLSIINWDMFVNLDADKGYNAWLDSWDEWRKTKNKEREAALKRLAPLPPINTNVQPYGRESLYAHPYSGYSRSSVHDQLPSFRAANFEQPWSSRAPHHTPPSAPDSGLNTPDYLSATGGGPRYDWTVFNGNQCPPYTQPAPAPMPYMPPHMTLGHHFAPYNNHHHVFGMDPWGSAVENCACQMCIPPKQPYMLQPYGSQPLVA